MIYLWFALFVIFVLIAFYVGHTWYQVGGLRGMAYFVMSIAMGVRAYTAFQTRSCTQWLTKETMILIDCTSIVPLQWLIEARFATDMIAAVCLLLLVDLYRAGHNSHRSFVVRAFVWFERVTEIDRRVKVEEARQAEGFYQVPVSERRPGVPASLREKGAK